MRRTLALIDYGLSRLLIAMMAVMVVTVSWQVASRYLVQSPSPWTEELATYLLIWISLLGAVYALRLKAHLGIDLLARYLSGPSERYLGLAIQFSVALFAAIVFVYGGARLVYVTLRLNQSSAALQIPMGYVYIVIPLTGVLLLLYTAAEAVAIWTGTSPSPASTSPVNAAE